MAATPGRRKEGRKRGMRVMRESSRDDATSRGRYSNTVGVTGLKNGARGVDQVANAALELTAHAPSCGLPPNIGVPSGPCTNLLALSAPSKSRQRDQAAK